jgi:pimeloyl-ACP methyl ester carboxylesterase
VSPFEYPVSRSEFLRLRGLRHHLRVWGDDGKPVLFLVHGWLDVSATFAPLVAPLLDRWQVRAPDWRGFGHSEWPQDGYWFQDYVADLDAILEHESPGRPVLLAGHSMGAQAASLYAGLRPSRVAKLILLDGLLMPDMPAERTPFRFTRWLDQLREPPRQKSYASFEELAERIGRQHPTASPAHALFIARCWGREDGHGRITLCADPKHRLDMPTMYRSADSEAVWRQVTAPTLFIDAGKSNLKGMIGEDERARRHACFRDRREVVLEDAGHMLHFTSPVETAKLIADFLDA